MAQRPSGPQVARPNPALTPGEVFDGVTTERVCVPGYARRMRNVLPEQYVAVFAAYGIDYPQPLGAYELDHLIPLELGGDNDGRNLWPQPASPVPGFPEKDELENLLHDRVCSGALSLADAQRGIAQDWVGMYHRYLH
ncbi:MAG: HNH endonuclease [Candidatus Dormibacteraeota bacterium]|nr:HNH endonuclease [Candidatus Dormibacteraeota bacterium]